MEFPRLDNGTVTWTDPDYPQKVIAGAECAPKRAHLFIRRKWLQVG